MGQGFVYLAVVMDVYTRAIRGWNLSRSLDVSLTLKALRRGLVDRLPEIRHSDQGIQYAPPDHAENDCSSPDAWHPIRQLSILTGYTSSDMI